jgi:KaiC/GvpD/RAD55 family RecA-like ATPase
MNRDETGIRGFDELIQGGLLPRRVYLVSGPPGSGKTTFGVQFLVHGGMRGDAGLYVTLSEPVETIVDDMSKYAFNIFGLIKLDKLQFIDLGPTMAYGYFDDLHSAITPDYETHVETSPELEAPSPATVFKEIYKYVKDYDVKRLVIDSVSAIRFAAGDPAREEKAISRFIRNLKNLGCTTLLLSEMTNPQAYTTEQFVCHGVIFLHNFLDEKTNVMTRAIQIIKMRGTKHDCNMRKIEFTDKGIVVLNEII